MASKTKVVRLVDERGNTVSVDAEKVEARLAAGYKRGKGGKAAAAEAEAEADGKPDAKS